MEYFNNEFNLPVGTRVKAALGNTMNTNRIQYECCWLFQSANSVDLCLFQSQMKTFNVNQCSANFSVLYAIICFVSKRNFKLIGISSESILNIAISNTKWKISFEVKIYVLLWIDCHKLFP